MKRLILICSILLAVQTGLAVTTFLGSRAQTAVPAKGPLLIFPATEIEEMQLEDSEGHRLVLKKGKERWLLPDSALFPADASRVQGVLTRLTSVQRGWPEATTAEAATRLKVAPDRFERKLSLNKDGKTLGTVYFGSSPGLRKIYLRTDNDAEIQTIALALHELEPKAESWIDTAVLRIKPEQVVRIDLPDLRLERTQDGLQPAGLAAGEEVVKDQRDSLVKQVTSLTIAGLLGTENKPEFGLDNPALRYTLELEGGTSVEYIFGQPPKEESKEDNTGQPPAGDRSFVLKVSNQDQLFRVDGWQVEELKKATRAMLVRAKVQEPAASKPAGEAAPDGQAK